MAEYTSTSWGGTYTWSKSYIYAGSRLLFTATNNGAGGELKEYHHPDRLGTRMVTDPAANTLNLQSTLPFGTQFDSETTGSSNRLFTSYDRSAGTGLDNAVNRTYSPGQGRFTTVDPIGMNSTSPVDPQTLNLYSYVRNSPTDFVDPSGLNLEAPIIIIFDPKAVYEDRGGWFGTYWDSYFGASNGGSVDGDTGRRGPDDGGTVSTNTSGPGTPVETITDDDRRGPCERMADRAQEIANKLLSGANPIRRFDTEFTSRYIGQPLDGKRSAWNLYRTGGGVNNSSAEERGQSDFKKIFWQGTDPNEDQVHHFAAYFSGGINGQWLATTIHQAADDNSGDKKLGSAAYALGSELISTPEDGRTLERLRNIGEKIKKTICDIKK